MRLVTIHGVRLSVAQLAIFKHESARWRRAVSMRRGAQPLAIEGARVLPPAVRAALRRDGFSGESAPVFAGDDDEAAP